jgi:hypothetical protein
MYLREKPQAVPIELLDGIGKRSDSVFMPVLCANANSTRNSAKGDFLRIRTVICGRKKVTYAWCPALSAECILDKGRKFFLPAVSIRCSNYEKSKKFWSDGLGFIPEAQGRRNKCYMAKWPAGLYSSFRIILLRSARVIPRSNYIDNTGCILLSFLCTDLMRDRQKLLTYKLISASEVFEFTLNKKRILASIIIGPSGEPIELIQVISQKKKTG